MNRRERRDRKIAHQRAVRAQHKGGSDVATLINNPHWNLFDEVYSKVSSGVKVKCQGIYESVFCKE